jgi:hypothetical protein
MSIPAPDWATADEVDEHGRLFLAARFRSRRHFQNYLETGSLATLATIRQRVRITEDPLKAQREVLRRRLAGINHTIADATRKLAAAQQLAASNEYGAWNAPADIERQQARLAVAQGRLNGVEADLALFDLLHANE